MFNYIAGFDISVPVSTYSPFTARKIVTRLSNMVGIEQPFNITINYRDQLTNDPFSETYTVDQFPYSVAFTTNHSGNIILDSIESDYTGSGTCDAYLYEYEYVGSEDSVYYQVKSTIYVDSDSSNSPYYMPYNKNTSYQVLVHYYSGNMGDEIRVTVEGIKISGERITEICYLRDTDDYIRLSEEFFVITNISTQKLSGSSTGGALQIRTAENIDNGSVIMMGSPSISSNVGVPINTGYVLSKPASQVIFVGLDGNDNTVNETITFTGTYNNGNNSTTDNITILPASQNSQIQLLLTPDIEFLDHFQMNSYSGSTGNFQWGIIDMPTVPVTNNPPYVYAGILNQNLQVGTGNSINIEQSGNKAFKDPDGDSLTYTVQSENNHGDTSFISVGGHYINITPTNAQEGMTYNFTIRATDSGGLYAETSFNVEVSGGSQPEVDRFIGNIQTGMAAFIVSETPTHYKAVGWFDLSTLSLQTIIEPTIELTGVNVIMSKDYIQNNSDRFVVQELN